jgi:hypothetical protein
MNGRVLALALAAIVVVIVLTSLLTGDPAIVAAFGLAGLIILGGLGLNTFLASRQSGARNATDRHDAVPSAHADEPGRSESRPLGDTAEAHDEITPHDLPVGHPGRPAAERQAEGRFGTTEGNESGGAADADERVGERS